MKTILITGGAGFIGSHTADALLAKGYRVRVLDLLDPQIHGAKRSRPAYLDARIELVEGDVRNREDVAGAIIGVDAVFHFAALTGVGQSMYDIHSYCDVNVNGTAMLLDVLANSHHQVQKVVLSSSRAVYGEGAYDCSVCGTVFPPPRTRAQLERHDWGMMCPVCTRPLVPLATSEEKQLAPISVYALTKKMQEELLGLFSASYGMPCVILRYFNVYGSRQAINNPYTGIGAIFTNRALAGHDIAIYEDGEPIRDFVNVRDVVQANLLALENERAHGRIFNIGTGNKLTVLDLARVIKEKLRSPVELKFTAQYRIGDIRDCYADLTASREVLGYQPRIDFTDGVDELIAWAKGESLEDRYSDAERALRERKLS